jgi:LPXTG-motif cell wall-anchored protein
MFTGMLINHGTMYMFNDPSNSFTLAVEYNSLPKLTITGERVINGELTVSYQSSRALDPNEKIICILDDQYGDGFFIGCSPDNGGKASFNIGSFTLGISDYKMMLTTGVIGDAEQTTEVGMPAQLVNIVSALSVEGIEEGENFYPGEQISIEASGFNFIDYDFDGSNIVSVPSFWVPVSWSVSGGPSGNWAGSPYTAEFALQNPGSYSLDVVFEERSDSQNSEVPATMTRVINFTVARPDDGPFTVSYHPNGALGTAPMDMNRYYRGDRVNLMTVEGLSVPGAYFAGWSLTPDGPVIQSPYTMGSGDATLFAVWRDGELPEVPKTGDPASIAGFTMLALALAAAAAFVIRKRRAK